jgi:type I restriction enzyme, S subunit
MRLRPNENMACRDYVYYYFSWSKTGQLIQAINSKSVQPVFNFTTLKEFEIELPPISEQRAAVRVLSALDNKIELNSRMNETLEAVARAIFKDWFIDFGPTRAKMEGRSPYLAPEIWSLFPDRLDGDGMPEGWEKRPFGTMLEDTLGGDWGKDIPDEEHNQQVKIIRGTDIPELAGGGKGKVPTRYATAKKAVSRTLQDLDIVVEVSGGSPTQPTGRSLLITQSILDRFSTSVVCASFCRRFRPKSASAGLLAAQHLSNLYLSGGTWEYQNQSTGIANFQTTYFLEAEHIVWPGEKLCELFYHLIEPLVRGSTSNEALALAETRDLLLPKLMSGEIRVKDAERVAEAAL